MHPQVLINLRPTLCSSCTSPQQVLSPLLIKPPKMVKTYAVYTVITVWDGQT